MKKNLFFYAGCVYQSTTLGGGDRIYIELARQWSKKDKITIITSPEGKELDDKYGLENISHVLSVKKYKTSKSLMFPFLKRFFQGLFFSFGYRIPKHSYIYSTSNFIVDSVPCFMLKLLNPGVKWIGGYYLEPPNPFYGYDESKSKIKIPSLPDLSFYLQDRFSKILIKSFADIIYVTSQPDADKFPNNKVVIIKGGIDLASSGKIKNNPKPKYDAVFIGRFHPQKGVLELVDIWEKVLEKKPGARLAMIGNGKLEQQVKEKIKKKNLGKYITLFGFKDGIEKIKIFKNSKIVVHTSLYDSGGMAACEAMACKLPGVSYNLEALKTYYPKGMLKTPIGNQEKFAENILSLLNDKKLYEKTKKEAYDMAREWNWPERAKQIYKETF